MLESNLKAEFIRLFREFSGHNHPYQGWSDLVHMWSFAFQNAIPQRQETEERYLEIAGKYSKDKLKLAQRMLSLITDMLEPKPADVLGPLYLELEISNKDSGQFFTPPELSQLMANMMTGNPREQVEREEFITLYEPACGAGGMILAYVNCLISEGLNSAESIWVSAIDVDPVVARMCHLQLSLWNVPAEIVVGNTLTQEVKEYFHTPAHHLGLWEFKIRRKQNQEKHPAQSVSESQTVRAENPMNLYRAIKEGDIPYEKLDQYKEQLKLDF
ncbi:MAG: N-6 DNA methylase [Thiolinea sp.]